MSSKNLKNIILVIVFGGIYGRAMGAAVVLVVNGAVLVNLKTKILQDRVSSLH